MEHRQQEQTMERSGLEIAVVAIAGSFPGAPTVECFWGNLVQGSESLTFPTEAQLAEVGVEHELLDDPDFVKAAGGILEDKDTFDAALFGFTPLEAQVADPQLRKLLECAWTALESAGIDPSTYNGLIGLYAGASDNFHWHTLTHLSGLRRELGEFAASQLTGREFIATRIAYALGLKGPAITIATACSTSLTAIHAACQALLNGECHVALAGGVSVQSAPAIGYKYQQGAINSKDGHCRAFDSRACGTVAGEGAGLVALKPLEEAEMDRDPILAVIKGTAVNNDGRRKGAYSAPSIEGQAEVIAAAQEVAGVEAGTIGYIEAHGTGTVLGDPIEIEALNQAFAGCPAGTCAIGSVKTNIGHLDAAAGIAGFIKAVLTVNKGQIPPSLHFSQPNPQINFSAGPFYVNHTLSPWTSTTEPRRAGVSSFGIGGTNAHVIVEEYIPPATTCRAVDHSAAQAYWLLPLSAHSEGALRTIRKNLALHLKENPHLHLPDVAYTLQTGRQHLGVRATVVCSTLAESVEALYDEGSANGMAPVEERTVVFMFPGQGAQYAGMGKDLYQNEPVFRREIDRCFETWSATGLHLEPLLFPAGQGASDPSAINDTAVAQPLLFAVEYAMAKLLISLGIEPVAMMGHSLGEFVAAHLAEVFSLEDALRLVSLRGRLMSSIPEGAMLGISASEDEVVEWSRREPSLSLAAVNTRRNVVLSGPEEAITRFEGMLAKQEIQYRRLHTSHAFHSSMMEPIIGEFIEEVARIKLYPPKIPYISNVTGHWIAEEDAVDPAYWGRHLRQTVRFGQGIRQLLKMEHPLFLELGPGTTLGTFVTQHLQHTHEHPVLSTMPHPREPIPQHKFLLQNVGRLWQEGQAIGWRQFHPQDNHRPVELPTYPFAKTRYWIGLETPLSTLWNPGDATRLKWKLTADQPENQVPTSKHSTFVPPNTRTQRRLAVIWQSFFGIREIGVTDDFFALGGDSLKATALAVKIQKELRVPVPLQILFNNPTIGELAHHIDRQPENRSLDQLPAAEEREYYPLSPAQERLFILHRWNPADTAYNLPAVVSLEGELDRQRLEAVFQILIKRHRSLRTAFMLVDRQPAQRVLAKAGIQIEFLECAATEVESALRQFVRPFDLSSPPLLRVGVVTVGDRRHLLVVDMHHIVSDGASITLLQQEFIELYKSGEKSLPPLHRQYTDFAVQLHTMADSGEIRRQERFWLDLFSGEIPVIDLPLDFPRPPVQKFSGGTLQWSIDEKDTTTLTKIAATHNATPYMVMVALLSIMLSKISGQEDIVVGSPTSGRNHPTAASMIGMFVNTLALRNNPRGDLTFSQFLRQIRQLVLDAFANQDVQFDHLVQQVAPHRDPGRNPLFDVMLAWQRPNPLETDLPDMKARPYQWSQQSSLFDLVIQAVHVPRRIHLNVSYAGALFKEETVRRFIEFFQAIVTAVTCESEIRLDAIDITPIRDREAILRSFNNTGADFPNDSTLHELFIRRADSQPDAVAVAAGHHCVSFRELQRRARCVAGHIRQKGARDGDIVPLLLDRGIGMVVGMLGTLMSGCAYLPLGVDDPAAKIRYALGDCAAGILVAQRPLAGEILLPGMAVLDITDSSLYRDDHLVNGNPGDPASAAYVIYTSGSTGKPKGVLVMHRGAVNVVHWYKNACELESGDRMLLMSTYTFDLSVVNVYGCLHSGAAIHCEPKTLILDIPALGRYIAKHRVSVIDFVPSVLEQLLVDNRRFESLRLVISSAERLDHHLKDRILQKGYPLFNHYGPTETTVLATQHICSPSPVTLGKPLANIQCYILSPTGNLQPIGVWGELYIAGAGVTPGYLNRPELTARQFVSNPFSSGETMYKTGDRARFLPDGSIECSGRLDHQVKLRGFRIEPGEIEARLQSSPHIETAAVALKTDGAGEPCLVAYVTAVGEATLDPAAIKRELAESLPAYMVPPHIIEIDAIPRTSSGKIDRKSLVELPLEFAPSAQDIPPATPTEHAIASIWKQVLGTGEPSILQNFFDAGGNSLKMIQVHQAIAQVLGRQLPVAALFEHTTIRALASYLDTLEKPAGAPPPINRSATIQEGRARLGRRIHRKDGGAQ
jgi:amino acid adenylation domain-containing protein